VVREREVAQRTLSKARVLLEALPYMKEHSGKTVVVKLGGAAMADPGPASSFAEDVALLRLAGVHVVVVHGGGPQISELLKRLGIETRFERGLRVTDAETLDVARMVLGKINTDIVAAINSQGVPAAGVSGDDGALFLARPKERTEEGIDLGLVGDIVEVRPALLQDLMQHFVPVVASTATDGRGQGYNVNADEAASALAIALGAEKLIFMTDVPGLYEEIGGVEQLLSEVSLSECERLIAEGVVDGGMVPKVEAVLQAMKGGVHRAHILDGRVPHALILEMFTPEGLGTMIAEDE
jgi:acetylglutamate kinase